MKRATLILGVILTLAIPVFFLGRYFTERNRQARNVRHDAHWFTTALKVRNERAVANYLAHPKMDFKALNQALLIHSESLMTTDFDTAPLKFHTDGSTLFATFECTHQAALVFYTDDGGDVWRVAEIGVQ